MLDTLAQGRLVVGLLRGTTNESLTYDLNPQEARERTDEGMELILKAWTEPQPFGWQGRHFQYRTVSIWPRPLQQPHPPTYALGTSRESCEFAARHRLGLRRLLRAVRGHGQGDAVLPRAVRALRLGADAGADHLPGEHARWPRPTRRPRRCCEQQPGTAPFAMRAGVRDALVKLDSRNIAGEARTPNVGGALPTTFVGSPDTVVEQVRRCREVVGAGVARPVPASPGLRRPRTPLMRALELFGDEGPAAHPRHLRTTSVAQAGDRSARAAPGAAFREGFVEADGFRIRYMEAGQGPPLVHLHGAGGLRLTRGARSPVAATSA